MALINQLNTSNTFQEWLTATTNLIDLNNQFVEGVGGQFTASSNVKIDGDLVVTGNVNLDVAGFDNLTVAGNLILSQDHTAPFFTFANTSGTATTRMVVNHDASAAYVFDIAPGANPTISLKPGHTFAFDLQALNGNHPFVIRKFNNGANVSDPSTYYNVGLTHVETDGSGGLTITTGVDAQGKRNGILYWKVPANTVGESYYYQCTSHASNMVGNLLIEQTATAAFAQANNVVSEALALSIALG